MSVNRKMHGPWRIGADGGVAMAGKGGFDAEVQRKTLERAAEMEDNEK